MSLAQVRVAARVLRRREEAVAETRAQLARNMFKAREKHSDTAIAEAAGITKGRVGQILGTRK